MRCFPFPSQDCHVLLLWLIRTPQFPMVSHRKWFTNKCCLLNLLYQQTCTCATCFDMFAKQYVWYHMLFAKQYVISYVISYVVIYIYLLYIYISTQSILPNFTSRKICRNPMATWCHLPPSTGFTKKLSFSALCGGISVSSWRVSLRSSANMWYLYRRCT